ncbi:tyrosine-type recombinase/integrase [Umezawaea sp. Da 62-37]|uniref:tyrosine-type recombinase/integrase n=1 Tax=Umezawaea sp. Da 62-37 TaxID=3075927 RepID=UPI0028F7157D|nr:tyrosine-type recombinase/integrase [Umezawaea sp. Da 62-37]WNV83144.1 tyrosine-type recombinase/integrase [Umezawaea sp. Da 62-37]WNV85071.1 tyrosine-type recombinase/integrase [Umezawaea sp. Da 62-37]
MAALVERQRQGPQLLELLMETVRPEFRAEPFRPPRDSRVFYTGICVVPVCAILISHTAKGLCEGHYQRWKTHERNTPEVVFERWLVSENDHTRRRKAPPVDCAIKQCNRAAKSHSLCHRHLEGWTRHGRPDVATWIGRTTYSSPATNGLGERDCSFPIGCPRWTDGPNIALCRTHYERWRTRGRPDLAEWFRDLEHAGDPRLKLAHLERHLRLEVQFGLQCRHDEASKRTMIRTVRESVGLLERAVDDGLTSLLDWDDKRWKAFVGSNRKGRTSTKSTALQFLRDTRLRLQILGADGDPWADQMPRDTWDLRVFGIQNESVRYYRFGGIPQQWLREVVKRWSRWRLTQDVDPATQSINIAGVTKFAVFLGASATVADLDRDRIEQWLAALLLDYPDANTRRTKITSLATFLRDTHRHSWLPGLSPTAFCYDDTPPRKPSKPRWIPEDVMRQMEAPANLALFPSDDGRLILKILMNCGLRLKDARKLPIDCIVRDESGAPYLAWLNYKMRGRMAFFPISEDLATDITEQQRRVAERFPQGSAWLSPGHQANLDGTKSATNSWWRSQLKVWLGTIKLVHKDKPTKVTAHQFRHTVGTRLINADVPQHVVQQLLDHMSPQMTAIYARLLDKTVREHWERATKVNSAGKVVELDDGHPLADAQWMRLSMVRAKVTLPNGYCGAPIQTDCEYANPCLDCRFFLTTSDFLDQHTRQRDETIRLITDAEHSGMKRIAEKNTKVLIKLDTLIATLKKTGPQQIVAGGQVEDLDATG